MIRSSSSSRRRFAGQCAGLMYFGASAVSAEESPRDGTRKAKIRDLRTISKTPDLYCGWPTVARRDNGQLLVVWSGGREQHVCPFGRVDMMRSDDEGETWTWPRTLLDGAIDDRDAGVVETAQGSLLVTTFTSLAYESYELKKAIQRQEQSGGADSRAAWPAERLERWLAVHRRLSESQRQQELGQWMIRSTDGGITWSKRFTSLVNSPHGPIQLSDGRLLYAGVALWNNDRKVGVCQSSDDGQSWQWLAEIPAREGDDSAQYHELHAVEASNGNLIAHIRNHNKANHRETLQSVSTDGGASWSVPRPIGVWGLPSFLTKLSDGSLLMSYGYRRPPYGNQARISDDHGESWGEPMTISADGASGDLGYPSTVQLGDGSLLTIWYERPKQSPHAVLRQARWSIEG